MRFLNPAGLWLLLGIPVLVVIYLIKAQHEDRPVSSTFIWRLSSRFMKKRLPMQKIRKIITFIMQAAVIALIAMIAARPAFTNGAACDYIAVIDASASMQIRDDEGISRFEYAVEAVKDLSDKINEGNTLSVIIADDNPYYLVQASESVNDVKIALKNIECTLGSSDMSGAIDLAGLVTEGSANASIIVYSDCDYTGNNIQVINLNKNEWDVEVSSLTAKENKDYTDFTAELVSYNRDASVTVGLKVDGSVIDAQIAECEQDTVTSVTFTVENLDSYDTAEVFIETDDGFDDDNSYAICNKSEKTFGVLLVSDSPLYLESALNALGNCNVTVVSSADEENLSGQDLYIFDGIFPDEYPEDGSVIVFGVGNLPDGLSSGATSDSASELYKNDTIISDIYSGISLSDTYVSEYTELFCGSEWEKIFYCGESLVAASKELDSGMIFTVISFDLHDTNLPMQTDFVVLIRNLVNYSVPELLKSRDFNVGDTVKIRVLPSVQNIYLEYPDESIKVLSSSANYASVKPLTTGIYTAVTSNDDGGEYADFFVHIKNGEIAKKDGGNLEASAASNAEIETKDAISEIWFWIAIAVLVLVLAEWWWYYREQY